MTKDHARIKAEKYRRWADLADKEAVESIVKLFSETRVPYLAVVQEDLALNTLQALLKSRLKTWSLLELSKAWIVPNTD